MKIKSLLSLAVVALAAPVFAVGPFAGDDFDGNTTGILNGLPGPTVPAVYSPDNSMTMFQGNTQPGNFPSSGFDIYGVFGRDIGSFVPNDIADDSANGFEPDRLGILKSTKNDSVFALADTENDDNSGPVTATWTFDISGRSNLEFSIDAAGIGDFDADDFFTFSYSIDGGASADVVDIRIDQVVDPVDGLIDSGIPYFVEMEGGAQYDSYFPPSAFFDEGAWTVLTTSGPAGNIGFAPTDDGVTNGDSVANDGFIALNLAFGNREVRAYQDGTFVDQDEEGYKDPLFANPTTGPDANGNNFNTGTQLNNDLQTITAPIVGTGSTLTIEFTAVANGSLEYVVFDNLVLSEAASSLSPGDFNADGKVDNDDLNLLLGSWGDASVPPSWTNGFVSPVDNGELNALLADWGLGTSTAVPEPAAVLLALISVAGLASRRR